MSASIPNDTATLDAVLEQARLHPRIHVATCPHDGPTSKGDCLNAIYRRMREYEARRGKRFRIVVTHDAEDLVHPDSLRLINYFSRRHAMIQIPVLPLPTPAGEFTHGLYCDEFAEYQNKDIPVRQALGGFLPSNGVGTGFDRAALDRLADTRSGRPFDPACLTEDYETGYRLYALGYRQVFVPVRFTPEGPVATREFFPRRLRPSISQRTRWVTGIALQGWLHHGWPRAPGLLVLARPQGRRRQPDLTFREPALHLRSAPVRLGSPFLQPDRSLAGERVPGDLRHRRDPGLVPCTRRGPDLRLALRRPGAPARPLGQRD